MSRSTETFPAVDNDETVSSAGERRGPFRIWLAVLLVTLGAIAYWLSPAVALVGLGRAVRSGDAAAVQSHVDLASIRRSLVRQIVPAVLDERAARLSPLERGLARTALQAAIESWLADNVTEAKLSDILAGRSPAGLPSLEEFGANGARPFDDLYARWQRSGFASLASYHVALTPEPPDITLVLSLRPTGWIATGLTLPSETIASVRARVEAAAR